MAVGCRPTVHKWGSPANAYAINLVTSTIIPGILVAHG